MADWCFLCLGSKWFSKWCWQDMKKIQNQKNTKSNFASSFNDTVSYYAVFHERLK